MYHVAASFGFKFYHSSIFVVCSEGRKILRAHTIYLLDFGCCFCYGWVPVLFPRNGLSVYIINFCCRRLVFLSKYVRGSQIRVVRRSQVIGT